MPEDSAIVAPAVESAPVAEVSTSLAGSSQVPDSSAPAGGEQGPAGGEPASKETITIDENGAVNIDDSVLDSMLVEVGRKPEEVQGEPVKEVETATPPVPNAYTPQELANAFINNSIDSTRVPEGMREYYNAIMELRTRQDSIASLNKVDVAQKAQEWARQELVPPTPPNAHAALSPQSFAQLQVHGKTLAAKYLGIAEADFDEYNATHQQALTVATNDIRNRALQIQQERYQKDLHQYNMLKQQQTQVLRAQQLDGMVKDFRSMPNWDHINNVAFPKWFEGLDKGSQNQVNAIMTEGNPEKLKKLLQVVAASEGVPAVKKEVVAPPPVMTGSGQSDMSETRGKADASKLGDMTPEERATWFINNKFV